MNYQIIKLSNGEDIVCKIHEPTSSRENSKLKVSSPLKMDTITRETEKGFVDSLSLTRWIQPYSDENVFDIEKQSIVIMTPASVGLSRYYEYVLESLNQATVQKIVNPTKKELKKIEKEDLNLHDDVFSAEDLEKILDKFTKKTIH
tara:strand:+ start:153 stop:590 length:438 start_codon:yes stop_codon:yes gene_type:complete